MKIAFFQNSFCTRAVKQATALKNAGIEVYGITSDTDLSRETHSSLLKNAFKDITYGIKDTKSLIRILKKEGIDLIHCHNFPDTQCFLAINCKNSIPGLKVIHDIHDHGTLQYINLDEQQKKEEDFCQKYADGFVFVSKEAGEAIKHNPESPSVIIYSKPNKNTVNFSVAGLKMRSLLKKIRRGKSLRLVYQGGMHSSPGHHRNYIPYFKEALSRGHRLDIYSSTIYNMKSDSHKKIYYDYKALNPEKIRIYTPLPLKKLYKKMPYYDAGLSVLAAEAAPYQKFTIPNKIFEYAACGLPSIVNPEAEATASYICKHKSGLILKGWENVHTRQIETAEKNILGSYNNFFMENDTAEVIRFYKRVLGK
ncbi:MAG: glycosyltransferase [Fibrobacterota bacterium]